MVKTLCISFFLLLLLNSNAMCQQKYDYTWVLSQNSTISPGNEASVISFSDGKVTVDSISIENQMGLNNASFSNLSGDLVLYSNACEIYDSTYNIIENGDGINPGEVHNDWCDSGDYPANANSLFLEDPTGQGLYYFHKDIVNTQFQVTLPNLMYSYIDNEDLRVVEKNIKLDSIRYKPSGYMEAIQHGNGVDWWLVDYTEVIDSGLVLKFLIDSDGVSLFEEVKYDNQSSLEYECSGGGQACFSPDGSRYALYCPYSGLDIFDFNRMTCEFTNFRNITIPQLSIDGNSGLAFSPSGRYIYIANRTKLVQVDLDSNSSAPQIELIDTYDNYVDPLPTSFAWMQIGPDCRIYMTSLNSVKSYHVINKPDEKGKDCDFVQRGLKLPNTNSIGSIPNHPVFRLDGDEVCDPTITSVFNIPLEVLYDLDVYPNPTSDAVTISFPDELRQGILYLRTLDGLLLYNQSFGYAGSLRVSLAEFEAGIYIVEVVSKQNHFVGRVLKVD